MHFSRVSNFFKPNNFTQSKINALPKEFWLFGSFSLIVSWCSFALYKDYISAQARINVLSPDEKQVAIKKAKNEPKTFDAISAIGAALKKSK